MLFWVSTRVCRFGRLLARPGARLAMRLRAHSSVCRRGDSGKLARLVMTLSVKSMASWSYSRRRASASSSIPHAEAEGRAGEESVAHLGDTQILDGRDFVPFFHQCINQLSCEYLSFSGPSSGGGSGRPTS